MTFKVSGGIITDQMLTGGLRFFKMTGPFAWTVSNGSVNLPVFVSGGAPGSTTYHVVGNNKPVPNSAADFALQEISKQCTIVIVSLVPGPYSATEIHFACASTAFGWGASTSPELSATAVAEMQAAVNALGVKTVYVSVGAANQSTVPVTAAANLGAVTISETSFILA